MMRVNHRGKPELFHVVLLGVGALCFVLRGESGALADQIEEQGKLELDQIPGATFRFDGLVGRRVQANVENWLIVAPRNNPGLLDMFARRDAGEKPDLVPWAGEFVGKYLLSGVEATRMSDDPRLRETLRGVVDRLVARQADEG